ncbi:MAG: hypothetical protein HFE49_04125 [Clostridia bacterium]|nr:hypothetical protein [Clostridia bacterium]
MNNHEKSKSEERELAPVLLGYRYNAVRGQQRDIKLCIRRETRLSKSEKPKKQSAFCFFCIYGARVYIIVRLN